MGLAEHTLKLRRDVENGNDLGYLQKAYLCSKQSDGQLAPFTQLLSRNPTEILEPHRV